MLQISAIQWAVWANNSIAVPLCTTHPPAELSYVISDSDASIVIYHPSFHYRIEHVKKQFMDQKKIWISYQPSKNLSNENWNSPISLVDIDKSKGGMIIYTSGKYTCIIQKYEIIDVNSK
jgi:malonyl-CoA/methylmalonyl-CoA synthetase